MRAVTDTEPGNIGPSVFDTALRAARGAVDCSSIQSVYDRMLLSVESIPDRLVRAVGQRAASEMFVRMSVQGRPFDDGHLQDMESAAVRAATMSLQMGDAAPTIWAAIADVQDIAKIVYRSASESILLGAPVHAATVAVFEAAIRGVPPDDLDDAITDACNDLQDVAGRHDDRVAVLVQTLAIMINDDDVYPLTYQTAVRSAMKLSQDMAADRIVDEIVGNIFEGVYMALVAAAYANSDRYVFESGYDEALAAAFRLDPDYVRLSMTGETVFNDLSPNIDMDDPAVQRGISHTIRVALNYKGDPARRKMFMSAIEIDCGEAVSSGLINGIISLYDMA